MGNDTAGLSNTQWKLKWEPVRALEDAGGFRVRRSIRGNGVCRVIGQWEQIRCHCWVRARQRPDVVDRLGWGPFGDAPCNVLRSLDVGPKRGPRCLFSEIITSKMTLGRRSMHQALWTLPACSLSPWGLISHTQQHSSRAKLLMCCCPFKVFWSEANGF